MTLGHEIRALKANNDSRLKMRITTLGCDLRALNAKNDSES